MSNTYYRSPKLLEACRKLECQHCGSDDGTVCAAHSNQSIHGKGKGIKAHDCFVAALCWKCHFELDEGLATTREEKREMWNKAHNKTYLALFQRGLLKVAA
jgi:hypothetical protein